MEDNIMDFRKGDNEKIISITQAAKILGIPYSTTRRRIFDPNNNIGFYDYGGGEYRVIEADIWRYKERCRRGGIQDSTKKNVG